MYAQIKKDIAADYYKNKYSNDGQRFVAWYLRNIYNLDEIQSKECITDGAGDKQIDAVFIDHETATVHIIQGKFYENSVDSEAVREVLASWAQIKDLAELQNGANEKLCSKIPEISDSLSNDDYDLVFELILPSTLTPPAMHDFELYKNQIMESEVLPAELILVDGDILKARYEETLNKTRPYINHRFNLETGKYLKVDLAGTQAVITALPLKECISIPHIKDGILFRKNVRQSLGSSNKVNKQIARTIKKDRKDFFFLHNGITAICSKLDLKENVLTVEELNVVNGCQSLSTIYNSSESIRNTSDGYVLFRFYEIADSSKWDLISRSTNSQSAVKARDLRSNDPAVLSIKKAFEQRYSDGYFVTKRCEEQTLNKAKYNEKHVANLTDLGKNLMAWHSQRPTMSYSETAIFDKYFSQLFKKDYAPENVMALQILYQKVLECWNPSNPLSLNESLLAMKAYAPRHHLYTMSAFFCEINKMPEAVPNPAKVLKQLKENNFLDQLVEMSGACFNMAFENAYAEAKDANKVFSQQNWIKAKGCLKNIRDAIRAQINTFKFTPDGKMILEQMKKALSLSPENFESRWSAD